MKTQIAVSLALVSALGLSARADAPPTYAITGARIVTVAGPPIDNGTIVLRNGLIEAVGTSISAPRDAILIQGKGLTVYPGLIDMGNSAGLDVAIPARPQNPRTREEVERWKRQTILRPHIESAEHLRPDAPELSRLAALGITTVLAIPPGQVISGQSSLLNVSAREDDPQIGAVADPRRGLFIVKTPVALHVAFSERPEGDAYPQSLMGVIAFVRQSFLDAQYYQLQQAHYARNPRGVTRPVHDQSLAALQPALERKVPVAFRANSAREIRRALSMANEFKLDAVIQGGREADQLTSELKAQGARVLFSLNYPVRPRALPPDAEESVRVLRERVNAPKAPANLERAGVLFAFQSDGLKEPADFVKHAAKAVKAGLPAEAALRALTLNAAKIAGASDRLGSIEKGKIANLVLTDGDLFEEKTTIKQVFVDGNLVKPEPARPTERRERPGRPGS